MSRPDDFSDTDLSAWLDDELDAERRAQVDAWLREQPEAAARARLWAADREALRARLDPVLQEPVPAALVHEVWHAAAPRRWSMAMAAAAAGLLVAGTLIGAGGMWQWQSQRVEATLASAQAGTTAGWIQRAAFAHSVYVPEPRHPIEVKAQEEHLSRWLTRRIDIPVKLFDLRDEGFELMGGRLLPDAGGKSAQLMYESLDSGTGAPRQRVTVYLRKPDVNAPTAFHYEQRGELGMFYWVEAGAGYALVGTLPKERLLALAQSIYKQQPAPLPAASAPSR